MSPIVLVSFDEGSQKFCINPQAVEVLRSIDEPLAVVAVCGKARQGKSYILNKLIGQGGAFKVASTQRPCTKGLWMWSHPFKINTPQGNLNMVLIDTEGVDAVDQTGRYSTQIFCLAVLLSSLFVFNQMGAIDESALNQLSLISEMTKAVRRKSEEGLPGEGLGDFAPTFIWLLRDFYLELTDGNRKITPKEYLEDALRPVDGFGEAVVSKNKIRESIKSLFPVRDCAMLVRPVEQESDLHKLDSLPNSALRPEFFEGIQRLVATIRDKLRTKKIGNVEITGPLLASLVAEYVKSINEGAIPVISNAWMQVASLETRRAADRAQQEYRDAFDQTVSAEEFILSAEHQVGPFPHK